MNLVLFEPDELKRPLARDDRRARHVIEILGCDKGDRFDAGVVDGAAGTAEIVDIDGESLSFRYRFDRVPAALNPITVVIGLPRPQTARDVLRDATSLGVERIIFAATERGESSYAKSRLWTTGEYRRHLILGAEQAYTTLLPEVVMASSIAVALELAGGAFGGASLPLRVALDIYEATGRLSERLSSAGRPEEAHIALGAERGWSSGERRILRDAGYAFSDLGQRVLRSESALVAGIALILAAMGQM